MEAAVHHHNVIHNSTTIIRNIIFTCNANPDGNSHAGRLA